MTVTNYDMTRFLLPLSNAVSLALKCLEVGNKGDLFVIKPPACSVRTLADAFELHFNKKLEQKLIGVRPGEKMDETLLTTEEISRSSTITQNGVIYAKISRLDANIGDYFYKGDDFKPLEPFTSANTISIGCSRGFEYHSSGGLAIRIGITGGQGFIGSHLPRI
jgi:UDP-glucose 4-epimerase